VISSTIDYSTDLVCVELEKQGLKYLRVNRDCFSDYEIIYGLEKKQLIIKIEGVLYVIDDEELEAVYFRAPVFIRSMSKVYSLDEQLKRSQWSSFIRNLIVFERANWINHPVDIYRAENKLYQLRIAKESGFKVPETYVGNCVPEQMLRNNMFVIKSLDTALFYENGQEMFTYTNLLTGDELLSANLKDAPIIIQEYLKDKIDIRVTVIGNRIYPVAITNEGESIHGDWRIMDKEKLEYTLIDIPKEIEQIINHTMRALNLNFGGMDLIHSDGEYYFIEVNPTGEWGWLTTTKSLPIDKSIVELMVNGGENG
jgi:glutathione synthase/RimK-type ligase-like ATP-grasp enzyme